MKLFIWIGDGVLQDWTSGQIVALAPNLEEALKQVDEEMGYESDSFPRNEPTQVIDLDDVKAQNEAWVTWGGG